MRSKQKNAVRACVQTLTDRERERERERERFSSFLLFPLWCLKRLQSVEGDRTNERMGEKRYRLHKNFRRPLGRKHTLPSFLLLPSSGFRLDLHTYHFFFFGFFFFFFFLLCLKKNRWRPRTVQENQRGLRRSERLGEASYLRRLWRGRA